MNKNQATINVKFPALMQDWHNYMPEQYEKLNPAVDFELYSTQHLLFFQNELIKMLHLLRRYYLDQFDLNFTMLESTMNQMLFRDFMGFNTTFLIHSIQVRDISYSLYEEMQLMNHLQSKILNQESTYYSASKLTPMDEIFYTRLFMQSIHQVMLQCNVHDKDIRLSLQIGQKEQTDRINDLDIYHLFSFSLSLPSQSNPSRFVLAFSRDQMERFFKRFRCRDAASHQIQLTTDVKDNINTDILAKLGDTIVSLGDLQGIRRGDVLLLKKPVEEPVSVTIGNELLFNAQFGWHKNRLSVKLIEQLSQPPSSDDEEQLDVWDHPDDEERIMDILEQTDDKDDDFISVLEDKNNIENEYDWEKDDEY